MVKIKLKQYRDYSTKIVNIKISASKPKARVVPKRASNSPAKSTKQGYRVGDIVNFHGGTHFKSSYAGAKGYPARAGKAKITIANGSGQAHPWHLIHIDSGSNVYGWVDNGTFD